MFEYNEYEFPLGQQKKYILEDDKIRELDGAELKLAEKTGTTLYSEEEIARKFYSEYYAKDLYEEETILSKDVYRKEAHRNNNRLYADAFNVARNTNRLRELTNDEREILELASDESDYETAYLQGGPELAYQVLMDQAVRDLNAGIDQRTVLARYHIKMCKVKRQVNRERRNGKKKNT